MIRDFLRKLFRLEVGLILIAIGAIGILINCACVRENPKDWSRWSEPEYKPTIDGFGVQSTILVQFRTNLITGKVDVQKVKAPL